MRALLMAGAFSLVFTLAFTPLFIRLFKKLGWGQFIRDDGPQSHHAKRGTATMGGIIIILGTVISYFSAMWITGSHIPMSPLLVLFMMVGLGFVGFIDDFLKTRNQRSLGLGGWAKVIGQVIVASTFALLSIQFPNINGVTPASTKISLLRDLPLDFMQLGAIIGTILFVIWICLIVAATSNSVNVTDGLDGLATGSSILSIGAFIVIGFWQSNQARFGGADVADLYRSYDVRDPLDLAIVSAAIVGGLIGFLWYNTSPAKIFLGDTGSLAIGGALAALAILSRTELLLVLIGGLFVFEAGSVIVQRAYFKLTRGKRIFLMSPIHHHFELKGWAEVTVVVRFWIIGGLLVAAGVGSFYLEWLAS
ncbi:phospho-N-acetylmuramoyl-pentapeptide-transferase [Cryobacterium sp. TMT1-21]|uniref:Phospho-N-acetylmuramoyl-pentapeptide-transferase n=1 Tax=Cryobacterium shii TaxID=1259235 RepID=A0AAQ2C839_9MICO|nr:MULTISPECIES: phospho-N-acetylmuramoyl-pentapeptide-transferase [Cryobacterium]TFC52052.1 phospho-N-acetylmuramoyl-pentapeptide-transferase [Cryobacterium shii]TFC85473.1 phospho-N-acetylmuramoyl-pentapeptide-transferase [Cryobacterium sp. TmT2-59]TFD06954.1 phospho-N-acetylmuramoyl-pentapeptide-transferase [Cryobacterium sp. TMT1-21]TFD16847.1 phospho-N-acetylmuramoyl-pentapeptide-transferase [Cryobacterium sp. TMT2-23]TFD19947.1 phospho-N-acetylmuramoyl-pentapeptide-transferase [Cryobacte